MLRPLHLTIFTSLAALLLGGCAVTSSSSTFHPEQFDSTSTYSRSFAATTAQTCEAGRRALLSQGYVINGSNGEFVNGRKSFQPSHGLHVEVEFRVACAAQNGSDGTIAFVSALQDRYALKKSNNNASVGVPALGSLMVPFSSSDDALVKVASETLTTPKFYDGFFQLLQLYLGTPAQPAPDARARNQHEAAPESRSDTMPDTRAAAAPLAVPAAGPLLPAAAAR